jgi:hypothetical protein
MRDGANGKSRERRTPVDRGLNLRCYQVGGSSESHESPYKSLYWRSFLESEMRGLNIQSRTFSSASKEKRGYKRNDPAMTAIYYHLLPTLIGQL